MKYLLLILSLNVFAVIKVEVKKNGTVKYSSKFETQELADEWIADNVSNDSWGKKVPLEYTIVQTDITAEENIKKDKLAACDALSDLLKIQDLKLDELNKLAKCRGW